MATFGNNAALGFKFITNATWNERDPKQLTHDELNSGDIIFIQPLNQLYAGGIYIGITPDQATALSNLSTDVSDLKEKVGTTAKLSSTLLAIANDLKGKLDGGSYDGSGTAGSNINKVNGTSYANVVDALNALNTLVSGLTTGVSSVNGETGAVTLTGANIAVSGTNSTKIDVELGKKVAINTNADAGANTGKSAADYTDTKVIGDAIEAAHAAATTANTNAGNKIAKSTGTASTLAGDSDASLTPADLTNADAIVSALVTAYNTLVGTGTHEWGQNETKTLGTLRDLIATLRTDLTSLSTAVGTLSDADFASIVDAIGQIKAELADPANQGLQTFLDDAQTILGGSVTSGDNKGKYETKSGANGVLEYASNLGQIITNLEKEISAAKDAASAAGVTKITEGDGITVTNNGVGNVTVNANSGAKLTDSLTAVTNGATTAQGATIQAALNAINAKAAQGITDAGNAATAASNAATAASNAQTDATAALNQLKWTVV